MDKNNNKFSKYIDQELNENEKITWSDQPIPSQVVMANISVFYFGILLIPISIIWIYLNSYPISINSIFTVVNAVPILFIVASFFALLSPFRDRLKAKRTIYIVTNQRAFTVIVKKTVEIENFLPLEVKNIKKDIHIDGSGNLTLMIEKQADSEGHIYTEKKGFIGVKNLKEAETKVLEMLKSSDSICR